MSAAEENASFDEIIEYVLYLDGLKRIERQTALVGGVRRENSAEHSWHVALFALLMAGRTTADVNKVVQMLLVHDLVEIHANDDGQDLYPHDVPREELDRREAAGADAVFGAAPEPLGTTLRTLWEEFQARETPESIVAHTVDRVQPILLNISNRGDVWHRRGTQKDKVARIVSFVRETDPPFHDYLLGLLAHAEERGYFPENPEA